MLNGSCHCGGLRWRFDAWPESATLCNCTICRRYGVLWIYGHEAEDVALIGESRIYPTAAGGLGWHFCPTCGCIAAWRAGYLEDDGRRRMAVNLRLAEDQDIIRPVPLARFDGLNDLGTLPRDGRTVGDVLI